MQVSQKAVRMCRHLYGWKYIVRSSGQQRLSAPRCLQLFLILACLEFPEGCLGGSFERREVLLHNSQDKLGVDGIVGVAQAVPQAADVSPWHFRRELSRPSSQAVRRLADPQKSVFDGISGLIIALKTRLIDIFGEFLYFRDVIENIVQQFLRMTAKRHELPLRELSPLPE